MQATLFSFSDFTIAKLTASYCISVAILKTKLCAHQILLFNSYVATCNSHKKNGYKSVNNYTGLDLDLKHIQALMKKQYHQN